MFLSSANYKCPAWSLVRLIGLGLMFSVNTGRLWRSAFLDIWLPALTLKKISGKGFILKFESSISPNSTSCFWSSSFKSAIKRSYQTVERVISSVLRFYGS